MCTTPALSKKQLMLRWQIVYNQSTISLEQKIIECHPEILLSENNTTIPHIYNDLCEIFKSDDNTFLFIHKNKKVFEPLFCMVCDNSDPAQPRIQKFCISEKFTLGLLKNRIVEHKFLNVVYSKENINRLKKHALDIYDIEHYYY